MRLCLPHSGIKFKDGKLVHKIVDKLVRDKRILLSSEFCRMCGEYSGISEPQYQPQYCVYCTPFDGEGCPVNSLAVLYRDLWISTGAKRLIDHPWVIRFDLIAAITLLTKGRASLIESHNKSTTASAHSPNLSFTMFVIFKLPKDVVRYLIMFIEPT